MRRIEKGFLRVETSLFDTMLVQPQVHDAAEVEEDEDNNEVHAAPSPPSPAHESSPPPQEHIPLPPLAQPAPPSSPPQQQPTQTIDTSESSMTLLYTLMETCATLTPKVTNLEQDKVAQALEIVKLKMDADTQERIEKDVTVVKEVNATEPTVFNDEEMAKRLQDEEIKQAAARERQEKEDLERAKRMIRVGGITQAFQIFKDMLKDFDREDLDALWRIAKEKFSTTMPTHVKEKALWDELIRLYEPNADDVF
uniref:Reverse transcriptase domain-containing protein n=1 Tax=Tanacetum cinerariifolium TaxID=118510 RepID=A0A699GMI7_TANCI|nr:hypothetical protein [Tanacetum cinerariifolium]